MAVPLLAIFAAGLGLQAVQQRGAERRAVDVQTESHRLRVEQGRNAIGAAQAAGLISPRMGAVGEVIAEGGDVNQTNSFLRGLMTERRAREEFEFNADVNAESTRIAREDAATRLELFTTAQNAALNPELQEQLTISKNLNVREVTNPTTGVKSFVPTRISPIFKEGLTTLRKTTDEARKINQLVDLVTREGLQRDPSAPITTEMRKLYNEVVAFQIADLGFGVPQAAEFLRVEQGTPDPTAFWTKVRRGEAATLGPLLQILQAKQRDLGNVVRDQADWPVDELDTTRAMEQISDAANLIPAANARIGDITQPLGGIQQTAGGQSTVLTAEAQVLAARANLLFNPNDPSAKERLRQSQDFAKRLGEDPEASFIIPDVLPPGAREVTGAAQGIFDLISTFARKGR